MLTEFYQSSFTGTECSHLASTISLWEPQATDSCSQKSSFPKPERPALTKALPQQ